MNFKDYEDFAMATKVYGEGQAIIYPALGLGSEAGEVQGKVKKVLRDEGGVFTDDNKSKIADELGDCLWYITSLANDIGYTLESIAEINYIKLTSRRERGVIHGSGDKR